MPRLIECGFCGRMFTIKSVETHEWRCPWKSSGGTGDRMPEPTIEPASGSDIVSEANCRPKTVTLSANTSPVNKGLTTRVCFVCGQRFSERSLPIHEKKCIDMWQQQKNSLPSTVKCSQKPVKLALPSVDGTADPARMDTLAQLSSQNAQMAECTNCNKSLALGDAKQHAEACFNKSTTGKKLSSTSKRKNDHLHVTLY